MPDRESIDVDLLYVFASASPVLSCSGRGLVFSQVPFIYKDTVRAWLSKAC